MDGLAAVVTTRMEQRVYDARNLDGEGCACAPGRGEARCGLLECCFWRYDAARREKEGGEPLAVAHQRRPVRAVDELGASTAAQEGWVRVKKTDRAEGGSMPLDVLRLERRTRTRSEKGEGCLEEYWVVVEKVNFEDAFEYAEEHCEDGVYDWPGILEAGKKKYAARSEKRKRQKEKKKENRRKKKAVSTTQEG